MIGGNWAHTNFQNVKWVELPPSFPALQHYTDKKSETALTIVYIQQKILGMFQLLDGAI